ncbi:MAG: sugar ABC transporter permease [Alphaproteobacteria bacterium]|nr:sugar ABC transporter permease [Alphaproteobacteria bacterium]
MAEAVARDVRVSPIGRRKTARALVRRKSLVAFAMALPLIAVIAGLVVYPAAYAIHLAMLNKSMQHFVGLGNYQFLFRRFIEVSNLSWATFWSWSFEVKLSTFAMVVEQSVLFAVSAVIFKAVIGFVLAHFVHNIPQKGQRKWRGMLLVPWVIPPAMSTLAWLWLFDPSYSAFNWIFTRIGLPAVPWLGNPYWARFGVILDNVWVGAPFFMIMYLAALKSVPEQLHEAAAIDGATWLQKIWYINLPMMRNIIAITALFSLIVTFANFDIVKILTNGGPIDQTQVFATWAFMKGIQGNDIPLGASVSLFMFPILAVAAILILRNVRKRTNEI